MILNSTRKNNYLSNFEDFLSISKRKMNKNDKKQFPTHKKLKNKGDFSKLLSM
jgi:hypothetical protein